jgi:hypothetical protein
MQMLKRMAKWKNRERLADPSAEPYVIYQPAEAPAAVDAPVPEHAAVSELEKAAILAP